MLKNFLFRARHQHFSTSALWRNQEETKPTNVNFFINEKKLNNFEKKLFVWSGMYKSIDAVPDKVSYEALEKAKSKFRIKFSIVLMIGSLFSCAYYIITSKRKAKEAVMLHQKEFEERKSRIISGTVNKQS